MNNNLSRYRGQIVVAKTIDAIDDTFYSFYKIKAVIKTGDLAGEECLVAYRSDPNPLKEEILVRLAYSPESDIKTNTITGHFITSLIPPGFKFINSEQVLLYGMWEDRMKTEFNAPLIERISNFFNPGIMSCVLYYTRRNSRIIPYTVTCGKLPQTVCRSRWRGKKGRIRNPGSALRKYLKHSIGDGDGVPRVVIIDEEVTGLEERIIYEFKRLLLKYIEMEPQS